MSIEKTLYDRSESTCELCSSLKDLVVFDVSPGSNGSAEQCLLICQTCREQIENQQKMDIHHWRCLNDSMWSQYPAVQVMVWRLLTRLSSEGWAQDLLSMLLLDDATQAWAEATGEGDERAKDGVKHVDSNGTLLETGDTVTLVKDLNVKGANFIAKRGTVVRAIMVVANNHEHIEGRVNGQQIVILTQFVKKSN